MNRVLGLMFGEDPVECEATGDELLGQLAQARWLRRAGSSIGRNWMTANQRSSGLAKRARS